MVSWITGPSRSGKTTKIYEWMQRIAQEGKCAFLLVPEQYSFKREQEIQTRFSKQNSASIQVLSFSRLAERIFKKYGGFSKDHATRTMKVLLMHKTLKQAASHLKYYAKSLQKPGFDTLLVETMDEMQNAAIVPSEFSEITEKISPSQLRQKAEDIALIYELYQELLQENCRDPLSDLQRATERVKETDFFKDVVVFVEDFLSFSGAQLGCLSEIMRQTDLVCSLCYQKGDPLFAPAKKTYDRICALAKTLEVHVNSPLHLQEQTSLPAELSILQNSCFRLCAEETFPIRGDHVHLYLAQNEYAEVDRMMADIWELIQTKSYRFRDILLLSRDIDSYRGILESGCKRYNIPYYLDEKVLLKNQPLFRCILGLLEASAKQYGEISALLQALKSGMTCFSYSEIAYFENYLFTWNLSFRQLNHPFTKHPRGYLPQEEMKEFDREVLQAAEEVRKRIFEAVQALRSAPSHTNSLTEALLTGLQILGVTKTLEEKICALQTTHPEEAQELTRFWDAVIDILETMDRMMEDTSVTLEEYAELFAIAVENYTVGMVPQTMDSVMIAPAHHALSGEYKAVFIYGVNDGVFPYIPTMTGIFSTQDRETFRDLEVELSKPMADWIAEERLLAYQALCKPTEHLFLSARLADISGNTYEISELLQQLSKQMGSSILQTQTDPLYLSRNQETAFLQLAYHYRSSGQEIETLRQYFASDPRLQRLDSVKQGKSFTLNRPESMQNLLGSPYLLSPTQVERFFQCPFSYFCANALKIYPRERAELNGLSVGTIVHLVLQTLLSQPQFFAWSQEELNLQVQQVVQRYLSERMGGQKDQPASILTRLKKIEQNLTVLCLNIQKELKRSDFRPKALESQMGDSLYESNWTIRCQEKELAKIIGTMDRVDAYHLDKKEYLRVIDYKSGAGKIFQLSDLYYGLNLQMLLYLFSQWKETNVYPAGALYLPTSGYLERYVLTSRNVSSEMIEQKIDEGFRMNGLLFNDPEILNAMEKLGERKNGVFMPLIKKEDEFQAGSGGVLVSMEQLGLLRTFVEKQLVRMCGKLQQGEIGAVPLMDKKKQYKICDFCPYWTVCGFQEGMPCREMQQMDTKEFFETIEREVTQ